jgi:hypothetical protein
VGQRTPRKSLIAELGDRIAAATSNNRRAKKKFVRARNPQNPREWTNRKDVRDPIGRQLGSGSHREALKNLNFLNTHVLFAASTK